MQQFLVVHINHKYWIDTNSIEGKPDHCKSPCNVTSSSIHQHKYVCLQIQSSVLHMMYVQIIILSSLMSRCLLKCKSLFLVSLALFSCKGILFVAISLHIQLIYNQHALLCSHVTMYQIASKYLPHGNLRCSLIVEQMITTNNTLKHLNLHCLHIMA